MTSLFESEIIKIDLPDAEIIYFPNFFDKIQSDLIYNDLMTTTNWQQDSITIFNKKLLQPRLTSFYGDSGKTYRYSNITMCPNDWNLTLLKIKNFVELETKTNFNVVLLNYYRDGKDSMGWHADNEKELGQNPTIVSLTFGEERIFQLKHNSIEGLKQNIKLEHGSLLLMKGSTQHFWKHQIAKTTKLIGGRINLTFRMIK